MTKNKKNSFFIKWEDWNAMTRILNLPPETPIIDVIESLQFLMMLAQEPDLQEQQFALECKEAGE